MKNILNTAILALALILSACTNKFEDYNTNPFAPTVDQMNTDNLQTGAPILDMMPLLCYSHQNTSQMVDQMIGMEYGRHIAATRIWGVSDFYYTYNPDRAWIGNLYGTMMPNIYKNIFSLQSVTDENNYVYAWALILKVAGALKISDTYGPIPYSKVDGQEFAVPFDNMPDLYDAMFKDLDHAIEVLSSSTVSNGAIIQTLLPFDLVYGANFAKWLRFANSLKLRMALRISNANPELAKQKAEEAVKAGVIELAADAAIRSYVEIEGNPFYINLTAWGPGGDGEFSLSGDLTCYMNGYNDPRREVYYSDFENKKVGARNGVQQTNASSTNNQKMCAQIKVDKNSKMLVMSAAEPWFLRAEGALNGWDMGGKAQELYEQGIRVSMQERGIEADVAENYLKVTSAPTIFTDPIALNNYNQTLTTTSVKWEAGSQDKNREQIIIQKWIATFPTGWEAWADFRRTGYPKWMPIVNNNSAGKVDTERGMRRIPYPDSEYNTNNANVLEAVQMLGGADEGGTDLWWAKK